MNEQPADLAREAASTADTPASVLIVDDVASNRATLKSTLMGSGYVFFEAENGAEALVLARKHRPDLMLLDIMMPGMDGYEVLRHIREDPDLADMPVVLVTALDDSAALLEGFDAGADDFISKPCKGVELRARVRGILRLNRYRTLLAEREARHRAEVGVRQPQARYTEVIESAGLMVQWVEIDGTIGFVNEHWLEHMGYRREEVEQLDFADLIHPDSIEHCGEIFRQVMSGGVIQDLEASFVTKDGKRLDVAGTIVPRIEEGNVVGSHAIFRDVTERKALEAQLLQAQKMEQVGRLTAGIAHDFGNTLAVVSLNASLVRRQAPHDAPFMVDLTELEEAVQDGLALVRDLMGFSRKADLESRSLDLTVVVKELGKMLRRVISARITVTVSAGESPRMVHADVGTIRQMVLNLANNARDSIESHGSIELTVDEIVAEEVVPEVEATGRFVRLSVADTGEGMSPETLEQVFDPFFTTKEVEQGTGLGLAMIKGLIEQQGGFITVKSTPGEGSVFHLHFPAAPAAEDEV